MNKAANLQSAILEAKIEDDELEQIHTIVQDGGNVKGALSNLAKKAGVKPEEVSKIFAKRFGKDPEDMAAQLKKKDEFR